MNADDFGYTRGVNEGILEAHHRGILTATTLMANGGAFDHAVRLAQRTPTLDVGCHLVLVEGRSLLPPHHPLPSTPAELIRALLSGRLRVYEEMAAQVRALLAAGIMPTHLDSHKHTHLLPPVLDAAIRVAREFGIRWLRRPYDVPGFTVPAHTPWSKRATHRLIHASLRFSQNRVLNAGLRCTDRFTGFQITGRFRAADVVSLVHQVPPGTTEFMCHPGLCTDELRAMPTRLKESRAAELEALTSPLVRDAVRDAGVTLVGYRALA